MDGEAGVEGHGEQQLTRSQKCGALHDAAGIAHAGAAEEKIGDGLRRAVGLPGKDPARGRRLRDEATGDDGEPIRHGMRGAHLAFNFFWQPFIVVVEEGDPLAARGADAGVARIGAAAGFGEKDHTQAGIGDGSKIGAGLVVGAINHDNDFQMRPGLAKSAANGGGEQRGPASGGNDGGHERAVGPGRKMDHICTTVWKRVGKQVQG
jgi:hypothetical protein